MSINQKYSVTIAVAGAEIKVDSLSMQHSLSSPLPSASVSVSHADYTFISSYGTGLTSIPACDITISVSGAISYTYHGVITNITGNENETTFTNSLTVMPTSYYATVTTSSFSGVGVSGYLSDPVLLMNAIVAHFNTNVFPTLGLPSALVLGNPVLSYPVTALFIAPRFLGLTCYDMLAQIAESYGLSVCFTWDNQILIGSIVNPVRSNIMVAKDMMKVNDFALDMPMSVYSVNARILP